MRRALLLLALLAVGCGASQVRTGHEVLNGITDVGDPTYALAVDTCDAARDAIVARAGTSREEDFSAMGEINDVCDGIVIGFESLRSSQISARFALDSGEFGPTVSAMIREALELWNTLRSLIPDLATLGREPASE